MIASEQIALVIASPSSPTLISFVSSVCHGIASLLFIDEISIIESTQRTLYVTRNDTHYEQYAHNDDSGASDESESARMVCYPLLAIDRGFDCATDCRPWLSFSNAITVMQIDSAMGACTIRA